MDLLKDILSNALAEKKMRIEFPGLKESLAEICTDECYKALQKIKQIIADDRLTDFECIEEIVLIFEELGSSGGNRHDFC